jgi:hypothetical protein
VRPAPIQDRVRLYERLYGYPEVLLPLDWPLWSPVAARKVRFWEGLATWRGGQLFDPIADSPYHCGPTLSTDLARRRPPIGQTWRDVRFFRPRRTVGMNVEDNPAFSPKEALQGVIRHPRPFDEKKDTLSEPVAKAEGQMEDKLAQFFLRNIGRVERLHDDVLEYELVQSELRGFDDAPLEEARKIQRHYVPPPLLDEITYRTVAKNVDATRELFFRAQWNRFFSRELKADLPGPLWKHFPDADALARYGGPGADALTIASASEDEGGDDQRTESVR